MADLFREKSQDWDKNERRRRLAAAIADCLMARVPLTADMDVMDFGAGTGLLCSPVAPKVKKIIAVDTSESMLEKLSAKDDLKGRVEIINQDIIEHPLTMKFDLIMSAMTLHHVEDTAGMLAVLKQNLRPGGYIALADLDQEDGTFHPAEAQGIFHHGFDQQDLQTKISEAGFSDISFDTVYVIHRENQDFPVFLVTAKAD